MQGQATFGRKGAAPGPAAPVRVAPVMSAPALSAPAEDIVPDDDVPMSRMPFATLTILAFLAVLFVLEMADAPMAKPGVIALASRMHLGAVSRDFVLRDGQVWRLLTAGWLHANAVHFIDNAVALVLIGLVLEPIIGWRWFAAVYTLGGIGGALGSIFLNQTSIVSVGASGAIMAVMACAAVMGFHPESTGRQWRIWRFCAFTGIPALVPHAGSNTDYSAHMGGAITGAVVGFALLAAWNHQRRRPPLEGLVATTGAVVGFLGVCAVAAAAVLPPAKLHLQVTAGLIPPDQLPASNDEGVQRWTELVSTYPQDPRAHAFAALAWHKTGGYSEEEQEAQKGLASPLLHAPEIQASLEPHLRLELVAAQFKQGKIEAGRRNAVLLCPGRASLEPREQQAFDKLKVCDGQ
jgi:rhomboid protease GluP